MLREGLSLLLLMLLIPIIILSSRAPLLITTRGTIERKAETQENRRRKDIPSLIGFQLSLYTVNCAAAQPRPFLEPRKVQMIVPTTSSVRYFHGAARERSSDVPGAVRRKNHIE